MTRTIDSEKRRARRAYAKVRQMLDDVDCGAEMLREIRPEFALWDDEYRDALAWLRRHDPAFPKEAA